MDIPLKVKNEGHQKVVDIVLPTLLRVLQTPVMRNKIPREQVKFALQEVSDRGDGFWGALLWYTRRRTVEDLILKFYFDDVKRLAG